MKGETGRQQQDNTLSLARIVLGLGRLRTARRDPDRLLQALSGKLPGKRKWRVERKRGWKADFCPPPPRGKGIYLVSPSLGMA